MEVKTVTEFRAALDALNHYSDEEITEQVERALAKGTVIADADASAANAFQSEIASLDKAALEWTLSKGQSGTSDDSDDAASERTTATSKASSKASAEPAEEDLEELQKALSDAIDLSLTKALAPIKRKLDALTGRVEAAGELTKALMAVTKSSLSKGSEQSAVLSRLGELERTITGVRGNFRGVAPGDFGIVPHPGDSLKKGESINRQELTTFLLAEQKAAQGTNQPRSRALHKALMDLDQTTSSEELEELAKRFGFKA